MGPINNVTDLFIDQTRISYFGTLNGLEHNHLLVIELEHLIFGFDRTDIEHQTYLIRPISLDFTYIDKRKVLKLKEN